MLHHLPISLALYSLITQKNKRCLAINSCKVQSHIKYIAACNRKSRITHIKYILQQRYKNLKSHKSTLSSTPSPIAHQASPQGLSGRREFLPLQSSFPQSWHAFKQKERPPLPLHSCEPHLQQCLVRFCTGSKLELPSSCAPSP